MYIYDTVLPAFAQFQVERGIEQPFDSVAKCYGTLKIENMEIIVLENLKNCGYTLWNKKKPLTRKHIDLVLGEYAKLHGVSIAMKDQKPELFEHLYSGIPDVFKRFMESSDVVGHFKNVVDEVADLLKGQLEENILTRWRNFKEIVRFILEDITDEMNGVNVILHGDCWSNNFLFKNVIGDELTPLKIAVLDWQASRCASPVLDLSYFIFASISEEDIRDLDTILRHYYDSLQAFVKKLGSDLDKLYPFEEFLADWKKYSKSGVLTASMIHKICATDKEEVADIGEVADKGEDIMKTFDYDFKNKSCFISRSKHVIKYAVENHLIELD